MASASLSTWARAEGWFSVSRCDDISARLQTGFVLRIARATGCEDALRQVDPLASGLTYPPALQFHPLWRKTRPRRLWEAQFDRTAGTRRSGGYRCSWNPPP